MLALILIIVLIALALYFFYPNPSEAREWLSKNKNPYALAGNRFASTEDALQFVESLYKLGAIKVVIPKDAIYAENKRIEKEGGPYADALLLTLPKTQKEIDKLFSVIKQEASKQGMAFNPEEDVKNNKVLIWWD